MHPTHARLRTWIPILAAIVLTLAPDAVMAGTAASCEQNSGGPAGGIINFSSFCAPINDVVAFTLGPFAKAVVAMTVVAAVTVMAESRDITRGFSALVPWFLVVGMLAGTTTLIASLGATV
jgi:hypothetical protein